MLFGFPIELAILFQLYVHGFPHHHNNEDLSEKKLATSKISYLQQERIVRSGADENFLCAGYSAWVSHMKKQHSLIKLPWMDDPNIYLIKKVVLNQLELFLLIVPEFDLGNSQFQHHGKRMRIDVSDKMENYLGTWNYIFISFVRFDQLWRRCMNCVMLILASSCLAMVTSDILKIFLRFLTMHEHRVFLRRKKMKYPLNKIRKLLSMLF